MRDLDLRAQAAPIPRLGGRQVISIGSTSKLIWGGLRVGWIRASAARIRELLLNPLQPSLSPPPLEQLIALDLLASADGLRAQRRTRLRAQRDHLAALLAGSGDWSFDIPDGGLAIWMRLQATTAADLTARARARGLGLAPGPQFSPDGTLIRYVRFPYTATPDVLVSAVRLLAEAAQSGCGFR